MNVIKLTDVMERRERRNNLIDLIKEKYKVSDGIILFIGAFEIERKQFEQASNVYYFFGLKEPAAIICQDIGAKTTLFVPEYKIDRSVWLPQRFYLSTLKDMAIDHVSGLGEGIRSCTALPFFKKAGLTNLITYLHQAIKSGKKIFTAQEDIDVQQQWVLEQLMLFGGHEIEQSLTSIDSEIAQLRRKKSEQELEDLFQAAEVTALAQEAAAAAIKKGAYEQEVQAAIEYVFTSSGAQKAFTTIVAGGINGTILHYSDNDQPLPDKGLVVVDCGARVNHYCCDVTRTYPVAGVFSERQKKVYEDVLNVQKHIIALVKPGMYLKNKKFPDLCLQTKARQLFAELGYDVDKDFPHGIGHYIGLDVHDVGSYEEPLDEGDLITVEPGIYLKNEHLGVRIEDVVWVVKDGSVCVTDAIPKEVKEVENLMRYLHKGDNPHILN